jgi:hypothetical protein
MDLLDFIKMVNIIMVYVKMMIIPGKPKNIINVSLNTKKVIK